MKKDRIIEWMRAAIRIIEPYAKKAGTVLMRVISWPIIAIWVVFAMICKRLNVPRINAGKLISNVKHFCLRYRKYLMTGSLIMLAAVLAIVCIPLPENAVSAQATAKTESAQIEEQHKETKDGRCDNCSGSGNCQKCYGDGECDRCYGDGGYTCDSCFGSGTCGNCYGSGSYEYLGKYLRCTYCRGSGSCRPCKGNGQKNCYYCDNSGDCSYCRGLGKCRSCKGSGKD